MPIRLPNTEHIKPGEVTMLARLLGKNDDKMPASMARYLLGLGFSDADKVRMHDLAVRNQDGTLSPVEKEDLLAYAKVGTILSILKSKARQVLKSKKKRLDP